MSQSPRTITIAAMFAALLAMPVLAEDHTAAAFAGRGHGGGALRCLRAADLTDAQKTDVKALFDASRPGFDADVAAIRAARKTLHADTEAGADKAIVGQDFLNVRAASKKLHDDHSALNDQILAKLSGDQKTKFQSCLDSHGRGMGAHAGTEF